MVPPKRKEIIAQMKMFRKFDGVASEAVLKAMQLQAWYLNAFMIAMTLADDDADIDDRSAIARKLLQTEIPTEFTVGNPVGPAALQSGNRFIYFWYRSGKAY